MRIVGAALFVTLLAAVVAAAWAGPPPPAPVLLVVRVNDSARRPVPQASVVLETRDGLVSLWAEDGVAEFRTLPGGADAGWEMTLEVERPRDAEGRPLPLAPVSMHVAPGSKEVVVVLPGGRCMAGRVIGPGGAGVADVRLRVSRASHYRAGAMDYDDDFRTDAEGRFDVGGLADEEHVLEVRPKLAFVDLAPLRVRAGAKDVVLVLRAAVTASASVLDAAGSPIPGAFVEASGASLATGRTRSAGMTDASGVARVEGLAPDVDYVLEVNFPSDDKVHEDVRIEHWRPRDETIHVAEARRIVGTVRDLAARPLAGLYVYVDDGPSCCGPPSPWHASTAADGTFAFHRVPRGELTLVCRLSGDRRVLSSMTRVPADATSVDVVFDPGRTLAVRFEKLQAPRRDERTHTAILRCDDASDLDYRHECEVPKEGKVVFDGLRDGARYRLVVTAVAGFSAVRDDLRAGDDVTVALVRGGTVRGRVLAPRGIHQVNVWVGGSPPIAAAQTNSDGTFVLEGIPEGRWRIHAETSFGRQGFGVDGAVEPGDEIELTLVPR